MTTYNPIAKDKWVYAARCGDHMPECLWLGPCPLCGSRCFQFVNRWHCYNLQCGNNLGQLVTQSPDWWGTDVRIIRQEESPGIYMQGDMSWLAFRVNSQDRLDNYTCTFGETIEEAINKLKPSWRPVIVRVLGACGKDAIRIAACEIPVAKLSEWTKELLELA